MSTEPAAEESPFKGQTGLRRIWNAFSYSLAGLRAAYRNEDAFRQESLLAALLIPLTLMLPVSGIGKALLAWYPEERVRGIISRRGLEKFTSLTLTSDSALLRDLSRTRDRGFSIDDAMMERADNLTLAGSYGRV